MSGEAMGSGDRRRSGGTNRGGRGNQHGRGSGASGRRGGGGGDARRPRAPATVALRGAASRRRVLEILREVARGRFAADLLAPRDTPFVRELALGVLRRRLTLDSVHEAFARRPLEQLDEDVRDAVRAGLYQMIFMDGVPPHAIVAETVEAVGGPGRGYVNALLRSVQRESRKVPPERDRGGARPTRRLERPGRSVTFFSRDVFPDPGLDRIGYLARLHSHPELLVQRWIARDGEEAAVARMEADNAPAPITLRPRAGRCTAEQLVQALAEDGVAASVVERAAGPAAVRVDKNAARLLAGAAFRAGLFSVQDVLQMDAAEVLDPRPGEVVWDPCAAPGGKATQLAELLEQRGGGQLLATDVAAERLVRLEENVRRLGLSDVRVEVYDLLAGTPPPHRPDGGFDAILLDAPCSNTAVLDRRPEARWRLRPDTFARMAERQRELIAAARAHLAPGGRLVFATCSLEPEEGVEHGLEPTRSPFAWVLRGEPT